MSDAALIADMMEAQARQLLAAAALMRGKPAGASASEADSEPSASEDRRADILDAVSRKNGIQRRAIARAIGEKDGTVAGDCAQLVKDGLIIGDRRTGYTITPAGTEALRRLDAEDDTS